MFVQNGHSYKVVPVGHLEAPPTGGAHKKGATARTLFMKEERDKIKGMRLPITGLSLRRFIFQSDHRFFFLRTAC